MEDINYYQILVKSIVESHSDRRGLAAIVCNDYEKNSNLAHLPGVYQDFLAMDGAFQELNFATIALTNKNRVDIYNLIRAISSCEIYPDTYNCFAFIFSGHGIANSIIGADGKHLDLKNIIDQLNSIHLYGLPRLILIDACQKWSNKALPFERPIDFVIAFSTKYEGVAKEDSKTGGFWTQEIVKELPDSQKTIVEIITSVNAKMPEQGGDCIVKTVNMCLAAGKYPGKKKMEFSDLKLHFSRYVSTICNKLEKKKRLSKLKIFIRKKLPGVNIDLHKYYNNEITNAKTVLELLRIFSDQVIFKFDYEMFEMIRKEFKIDDANLSNLEIERLKYENFLQKFIDEHKFIVQCQPMNELMSDHSDQIITLKLEIREFASARDISSIKSSLANFLKTTSENLQLIGLKNGCILVTYFIFTSLQFVQELTEDWMEEFQRMSALWMMCGKYKFDLRRQVFNKNDTDNVGFVQVLVSGKSPTLDTQLSLVADVSGNLDISQPLNITYQWFKNEEALLSETFFVLYFLSLKTSHSGKYCCQVTITSPQLQDAVIVTSIDHTLNLQGKSCPTQVPTITANIEVEEGISCSTVGERYSLICCITSSTDLSQSAISYEWKYNDEILPGESSKMIAFQPLKKSDTGDYSCQVTITSSLFQEAITVISNTHTLEPEVLSESIHCISREQDTTTEDTPRPPVEVKPEDETLIIKEKVEKDIAKLQEEFDSIDKQAFATVEREHVIVANFVQHLRTVFTEYNVKHREYYEQLFTKLCKDETLEYAWYRLSALWSYLDYTLLDHIIYKCHDTELKAKMNAYKDKAKEFCRQTRLYDFARFYTPFSQSYSRLLMNGFVKATLSITWEDNHLENLMILKTYITQEFFMPSFSIVLKDIQPHDDRRYMVALWGISPFLCPWLKKKMEEIDVQRFLGDNDIKQLCYGIH